MFSKYEDILKSVQDGNIVCQTKFVASKESYGSKPPKTRKEKSVASKAAKNALARKMGLTLDKKAPDTTPKEKTPQATKAYGSHNGGTHVYESSEFTLQAGCSADDLLKAMAAFERATAEVDLACDDNLDIDQMKREVEAKDMDLELAYRKQYGMRLNEAQATKLRAEKSANAIHFWGHQLQLVVYSKEELKTGLSRQNSDGIYVTIFRSKKIWRMDRLDLNWVKKHIDPVAETTREIVRRVTVRDSAMYSYTDTSGKIWFLNEQQYVRKIKAGVSLTRQQT